MTARRARRCGASLWITRFTGCANIISMGCGWMRCRRFRTIRRSTSSPRLRRVPTSLARLRADGGGHGGDGREPSALCTACAGGGRADAEWSDDFHHSVHALLTGERKGYYQDFADAEKLPRALSEPWVFQGEPFGFWQGRARGAKAARSSSAVADHLHPEPRPGRESSVWRAAHGAGSARGAQAGSGVAAAGSAHPAAVYGAGV